jgi:hypothetical protein
MGGVIVFVSGLGSGWSVAARVNEDRNYGSEKESKGEAREADSQEEEVVASV